MDSYNSKYPIEYYQIGTPYMFYMSTGPKHGSASSPEEIKKFGSVLKKTSKQEGTGYCFAQRYVGVVVKKFPVIDENKTPMIGVMFEGTVEGQQVFLTTKYICNHGGVFCDDKEQFEPSGTVDLTGEVHFNFSTQRTSQLKKDGGIALDKGAEEISGGIALDTAAKNRDGIALDK